MTFHVLSLGAGVNSTALLHVILDHSMPLDEVVFADTGNEKPETYTYLKTVIVPFLEQMKIPYAEVRAKETLRERCLRGHTVPDRLYRWSTRDYKIRPILKHLKEKRPVVSYIGYAFDEIQRMKDSPVKWVKNEWPLIDLKITRAGCEEILASKGWPIPPKSGCYFCPFASISEWRNLWKTHPELYADSILIEKNGSKYPEFALINGGLEKLAKRFTREEKMRVPFNKRIHDQQETLEECTGGYCFT